MKRKEGRIKHAVKDAKNGFQITSSQKNDRVFSELRCQRQQDFIYSRIFPNMVARSDALNATRKLIESKYDFVTLRHKSFNLRASFQATKWRIFGYGSMLTSTLKPSEKPSFLLVWNPFFHTFGSACLLFLVILLLSSMHDCTRLLVLFEFRFSHLSTIRYPLNISKKKKKYTIVRFSGEKIKFFCFPSKTFALLGNSLNSQFAPFQVICCAFNARHAAVIVEALRLAFKYNDNKPVSCRLWTTRVNKRKR